MRRFLVVSLMLVTYVHTRTQTVMVYLPFGLSAGAGMPQ